MTQILGADEPALLRLLEALRQARYHFVTVSPATHARVNARAGNAQGRSLADVFGWSRPFCEDVLPPALVRIMQDADVIVAEAGGLHRSRIRVSSLGDRLFIHSAFPTLEAESVFFGPDTYRFARVVREALARRAAPIARAIDIGCGAGPGAIVVADAAPSAEVLMADINENALRLARVNAAFAGAAQARSRQSDLFASIDGEFDLIVSNPPYLNDPLQRAYRHGGGRHGEALSLRILDSALGRLAARGTLVLYTGVAIVDGVDPFLSRAADMLAAQAVAWTYEEVDPDVFGEELDSPAYAEADRIAAVVLTVHRES